MALKLAVVSGPNRGTSFALNEGENTIGRQDGNVIVLRSKNVSRVHCRLVVNGGAVELEDNGSANGTFVNGKLTRRAGLTAGDKISVGEFVLEIRKPKRKRSHQAPPVGDISNVLNFPAGAPQQIPGDPMGGGFPQQPGGQMPGQMPGQTGQMPGMPMPGGMPQAGNIPAPQQGGGDASGIGQPSIPTDPGEKALWYFEKFIMPFFYGSNLKIEWRQICVTSFMAFAIASVVLITMPLLSMNQQSIVVESKRRASFIAKELVRINANSLARGNESELTISKFDREPGVKVAMIVDLEKRILAPSRFLNQYLADGKEATVADASIKLYQNKGPQTVAVRKGDRVIAVEPVKAYNQRFDRNDTLAVAVVSIDVIEATPSLGEVGIVIGQSFIIMIVLGAILMLILYRLTLKPLELLNEDIDKALIGEKTEVAKDFRRSELDQLYDVINAALQRLPKSSGGDDFGPGGSGGLQLDEVVETYRSLAESAGLSIIVTDGERKILFVSSNFEDTTGIGAQESVGSEFSECVRDEAFAALFSDMCAQAMDAFGEVNEDFEFSGRPFKVSMFKVGSSMAHGYVMQLNEGGDSDL